EVGIMRPLPLLESLSEIELSREPLVAVLSSKHPLAQGSDAGLFLSPLAQEPFVFFPRSYGSGLYAQLLSLARDAGFSPHFAQDAGEAMT
ncbi:LysR substrate-binding domain-containing protein, partial [Pseudomonas brassicacearum]|uniref:LysR substrate-binding domain-containing protein n=1 Tax=Pseudomonas brassicacearum TaxID=930166 RepID=UPI0021823F07